MHWMTKSKMQYGNLKIYSNPISQGMRQDVDTFVDTLKKMEMKKKKKNVLGQKLILVEPNPGWSDYLINLKE